MVFKRKKLLDKINLPIDDLTSLNTEILVLHTENDEAFESLNTSSRILSRIRKIWKFISFWQERLIGIMILSWFVLLGLSKIPLLREFIEGAIDFRLVLENMIIIPLIFILSVLAVFSSIGKLIHGPDYIIWLLTIKLKVLRKLKGDNVENVKVDFETKEGYKHTSIQKHSVKQISTWIKSKN